MIDKLRLLFAHRGFRKYAINTSWLFLERLVRMGLALVVGIYVVRYLGPTEFGQLSYAQSFVALFAPISALGLDTVLVRDLVKQPERKAVLLGTVFWLKVVGAVLTVLLIAVAVIFTTNTPQDNLFIGILSIGLFVQSTSVVDLFLQSVARSRYVVWVQLVQTALSSITKVGLVLLEAPLWLFVASYIFDALCLAIGFLLLAKMQKILSLFRGFSAQQAIYLLRESLPLVFAGLAVALYMRIDQVMLKEMVGNDAVGQFSAALKLSEAWYFIPMAICSSVFPAIVASKGQEATYRKRLQQLYSILVWLSVCVAIPVSLSADILVSFLYGAAYAEAATVLRIHVWTAPFVFLGVAMSNWLISEGMSKKSLYRTLLGVLVNVVGNFLLIPLYGVVGAAVATLLSQITANLIYDFFDPDVREQMQLKIRALCFVELISSLRNKVNSRV